MTDSRAHPVFGNAIAPGWPTLPVDQLKADEPSSCVAGPFGSNISKKYFVDEGVPVIRGSNLTDDRTRFVPKGFAFVSQERAKSYIPQHVVAGDLVFTCWGTIGQVGLIPGDGPYPAYVISNKQLKLRPNREVAYPLFLFYYFASDQMIQFIRNRAIGAAVPGINLGILKSLPVVLPPLQEQRRIAAVLAAYDELIENNLRRIEILEEMAQAVYREWFVNFRFPGHEDVALVDSPLGPIPEGWGVVEMSSFIKTQYGYTASTDERPVGPKFLRGMDFNKRPWIDWSEVPFCPIEDADFAKYRVRIGDVLVIRMADPGKVAIVEKAMDAVYASYVVRVTPDHARALPYWLFYYMSSPDYQGYISGAGTGTTRKSASAGVLTGSKLALPPIAVQEQFVAVVSPLRQLLNNLIDQNVNLRATRDLLLPKLVSGQLDVSDLDIDTEWLAS